MATTTNKKIVDKNEHPGSSVSWSFIAKLPSANGPPLALPRAVGRMNGGPQLQGRPLAYVYARKLIIPGSKNDFDGNCRLSTPPLCSKGYESQTLGAGLT
jgi:hypothetical protein